MESQDIKTMSNSIELSVIIPISERFDEVTELYQAYRSALDTTGKTYEVIYVLDGEFADCRMELEALRADGEKITIIQLAKSFGEATAITAGFENSTGDVIVNLPAYHQIEPAEIPKLLEAMGGNDMVIGRRWPRVDSGFNQFQTRAFHGLANFLTESRFRDLGCGARVFRRQVIDEVPVYGDQHRFLPVLAQRRGFRVIETDVAQSTRDSFRRIYRPGVYPRRVLDVLTVFFLVKFTKKPLRFFGLIGTAMFSLGGFFMLYMLIQRIFMDTALAERPALLLSALMVVLGAQLFALGLIGELIIFTHARELKEYTIAEIVN